MQLRQRPRIGSSGNEEQGRAFVTIDELLRLKHRAHGFSFLPRQPVHSLLSGRHASRLRGRGLNFEELRHYSEGDDTRTIDWRATARLGSPFVRVYSEERDRSVLLIVDQRSTMFFGSRRMMKSVAAAEVAALAAWRVTSLGDRIGGIVIGDDGIAEVRPLARDAGVVRLLGEITRHNAALGQKALLRDGAGRLNEALEHALRLATHDWLVCLIGDAAGEDDDTARLITALSAHNDVIAAYVFDPLEHDLPDLGPAVFSSGAAEIEVDLSADHIRRRFSEERNDWRARLGALSRRRAIPILPVSTARDVTAQLRDLIGQRSARHLKGVGAVS